MRRILLFRTLFCIILLVLNVKIFYVAASSEGDEANTNIVDHSSHDNEEKPEELGNDQHTDSTVEYPNEYNPENILVNPDGSIDNTGVPPPPFSTASSTDDDVETSTSSRLPTIKEDNTDSNFYDHNSDTTVDSIPSSVNPPSAGLESSITEENNNINPFYIERNNEPQLQDTSSTENPNNFVPSTEEEKESITTAPSSTSIPESSTDIPSVPSPESSMVPEGDANILFTPASKEEGIEAVHIPALEPKSTEGSASSSLSPVEDHTTEAASVPVPSPQPPSDPMNTESTLPPNELSPSPSSSPTSSPVPTPVVRVRTPEEEALRQIYRDKLQQALVLFQEAEQYRLQIHPSSSTLTPFENGKKALIYYKEAAGIGVGPGSSNAFATLARMYEIGWDGGKEITHISSISSDYSYTTSYPWMNRLLKLLNLSGKSYRVPRLYTPSSSSSSSSTVDTDSGVTVSSINYENYGILVYPNITQSIEYYKESAALGNPEAQFTVGVLHAYGLFGVESNESKAITNYYFSSLGGSLDSQIVLSHRHTFGHGVPRSCAAAVVYLEEPSQKAVKLVDDSYGLLTYMPQSYIDRLNDDALETITADSNALRAKRTQFLSPSTDGNTDTLTNENSIDPTAGTTSADNTVVSYYHNAADKGAVEAAVALGHLYLLGARGVTQNLAAAVEQFHNAAEKHDLLSMSVLGFMYLHGIGVTKDPTTAAAFLTVPVQANFGVALNTLGYMHLHGIGVRKDAEEGYRLIRKAALEAGSLDALYNLGLLHLQGINENINGITKVIAERNFQTAADHFRNAAIQGHIQASVKLGTMQALGIGVAKSCESALSNLRNGIVRVPTAFPVLEHAYRALTAGNVPSALLEYARAAEMGWESGAWNAAYLLDEGLVPEAVPYQKQNITVPSSTTGSTSSLLDASSTTIYAYPPEAYLVEPSKHYKSSTDSGSGDSSSSTFSSMDKPSSTGTESTFDSVVTILRMLSEPWYALVNAITPDGLQTSTPIEQRTLRFYLRSTGFSNGVAQLRIGDYHYYGRAGLPQDSAAAAERYRSACLLHIPEACFNLGTMYERGDGVDTDVHLAKRYYDLTIEEQKQYRGLLLSSGSTSSSIQNSLQSISVIPAKIMLHRLTNRKLMFRIRNQLVVPILELLQLKSLYLEFFDSWLGIPIGGGTSGDETETVTVPNGKTKDNKDSTSMVTATPSATTPTTTPTPSSTYPQDRVRDAINKHKAARNTKKRSDSWFSSLFGSGGQGNAEDQGLIMNTINNIATGFDIIIEYFGNIAHTMVHTTGNVLGVTEDLERLTKEDSLMIILVCFLIVIVWIRSRRLRLHRLRLRQQLAAPGGNAAFAHGNPPVHN